MTGIAKLTALFSVTRKAGAQFTSVDGWLIPATFTNMENEVSAARQYGGLADCSANSKFLVEGEFAEALLEEQWQTPALPVGQGAVSGNSCIIRLRADQYLISTSPGDEAKRRLIKHDLKSTASCITITEITHGRFELRLVGPASTELLSRLCGLNFDDDYFPNMSASQSSVAKTRQLILRRDLPQLRAYSLIGDRSVAEYVWGVIIDAGTSLGIQPLGYLTLQHLERDVFSSMPTS